MNDFYFKKEKVLEIFDIIKNELKSNKKTLEKAFKLDYKEWEYDVDFDKIISEIDLFKEKEYLPIFSKKEVIDGFGKICLVCNQNPYLIFNFILSAIYTNNKVEIVLENKMLASNIALIESIKKAISKFKVDNDTISYVELINKDDIISKQDNYDLIYYFGNKEEYLSFIKRIHIDTKFENLGEINLYSDCKEYKKEIIEIDKWAYLNEFKVNFYNGDLSLAIKEINRLNSINETTIIFSKDIDKITKFIKEIKAEKIYVNRNSVNDYKFETNLNNLVYRKVVEW